MSIDRYRQLLRSHDWSYDYSDDHRVWKRGQTQRDELESLAKSFDPDYKIWNSIAPLVYQRPNHAKT